MSVLEVWPNKPGEVNPQGLSRFHCGAVILQKLSAEQRWAVAMATKALEKFRAFLLADGNGLGKTWEAIATAAIAVEQGQTVLIVATRRALRANFQYGQRTIGGAYREAFDGLGLTPIILKPSQAKRQEAGGPEIFVTSYECLPFVDYDRKNTLLVLDECQALKNVTSQPGGFGAMRIGDVERVLYMTATPLDRARQLRYMARLFAPALTKTLDPTTGQEVWRRREKGRRILREYARCARRRVRPRRCEKARETFRSRGYGGASVPGSETVSVLSALSGRAQEQWGARWPPSAAARPRRAA